jgi:O-antigen/teichoic acid export membrane protein
MSSKSSYRTIVKSSSIFGGVQVIQILVSIVRGKFVAILIGTTGMGISSLFMSSLNMINMFSALGLNYSAVRELSISHESGDLDYRNRTALIFRRWLLFSSLLGTSITIIFAAELSKYTFGNTDYTWHFIFLSIFVFFTILNGGNITLLRGTRRIKDMGKASLAGAFIGVLTALPLYYFFKLDGIAPAFILGAISNYLIGYYFVRKIKIRKIALSVSDSIKGGIDMAKLGVTLMVAGFLGTLTIFAINSYVSNFGSISDVGLYQAGMGITNRYIGLVLTAMSMDFFPRLSAISSDNLKMRNLVNEQGEITVLVAAPLLTIMILSAPVLIRVLLTAEFGAISLFIRWTSIAMIFKLAATAVGYISFAKGDKKVFLFLEGIGGNLLTLSGAVIGYTIGGLTGMAIFMVIMEVVFLIIIFIVTYKRYDFYFSIEFMKLFGILLFISICVFIILFYYDNLTAYLIASLFTVFSCVFSFKELNKRIGIKEIFNKIKFKNQK